MNDEHQHRIGAVQSGRLVSIVLDVHFEIGSCILLNRDYYF